jgi:hypothetical protein
MDTPSLDNSSATPVTQPAKPANNQHKAAAHGNPSSISIACRALANTAAVLL